MCGGQLRHGDQPEQEELADQQSEPLPGDTLGQAPQPHAIHGKGGSVIGRQCCGAGAGAAWSRHF